MQADVSAMELASEGVSGNGWAVEMLNTDGASSHSFVARGNVCRHYPENMVLIATANLPRMQLRYLLAEWHHRYWCRSEFL